MNIHKSQLLYYSPGDYMGGAHTALGNGQDHQTLSSQRLKKGQTKLPSYWTWPIYTWFTCWKWWFSISISVYQRVIFKMWLMFPEFRGNPIDALISRMHTNLFLGSWCAVVWILCMDDLNCKKRIAFTLGIRKQIPESRQHQLPRIGIPCNIPWHDMYIYMIWVLARSLQKMTFLDSLRLLNMLCWAAQSMCSPTGLRDSPTLGHLRTKSGTTPFSERWKGYHPKNSYWNYWSWHFQPRRLVQIPRTGVAAIDYH